jgi:histone acetyltransferase MYST1
LICRVAALAPALVCALWTLSALMHPLITRADNKRVDEWLPAPRVEHPLAAVASAEGAGGLSAAPSAGFGAGLTCSVPAPGHHLGGLGSPSGMLSPSGGADGMFSPAVGAAGAGGDRKLTRNLKRRYDEMHHIARPVEELAPLEQSLEREHEEKTKVKNIMAIELGRYECDTWYYAPYPAEYATEHTLLMCEFCLKYMRKRKTLLAHKLRCGARSPPGAEIYRHPARQGCAPLSMWEVDGKRAHTYCQSLCLLAKLFLDHKTLYYDVDPFLFYVLTERDDAAGCHRLVGYFSKEKASSEEFNLACILTLPPYQRKGYGRFLIAFSYELSKREQRIGTPERPLSDLGAVSYRSYWMRTVLETLREHRGNISVKDISARTAIRQDDVVSTLQGLGLLKWWKGQHIISVTPRLIEEHLRAVPAPNRAMDVDPARLNWTPYGSLLPPRR